MKVLVIDDSSTMRKIIMNNLKQMGYSDFVEAGDGKEALEKWESDPSIQLVLCDWNMPVMNGYDFLVAFRAKDKKTPFIMVTTEAEKKKIVQAIQAGVNNYILKPFTPDGLKEKVEQTLKKVGAK